MNSFNAFFSHNPRAGEKQQTNNFFFKRQFEHPINNVFFFQAFNYVMHQC